MGVLFDVVHETTVGERKKFLVIDRDREEILALVSSKKIETGVVKCESKMALTGSRCIGLPEWARVKSEKVQGRKVWKRVESVHPVYLAICNKLYKSELDQQIIGERGKF